MFRASNISRPIPYQRAHDLAASGKYLEVCRGVLQLRPQVCWLSLERLQ